jgi:hypothetical protein
VCSAGALLLGPPRYAETAMREKLRTAGFPPSAWRTTSATIRRGWRSQRGDRIGLLVRKSIALVII